VLRSRDAACCGDVRKRAIEKKLQIEHKIKAMKAMSKALDQLIADCANEMEPVRECTIMAAFERANMADRVRRFRGRPDRENRKTDGGLSRLTGIK
jgi:MerR family Zn(II)-responsive transcriptional regulator of zntA